MPAPDRSGYLDMVTRLIEKMSSLRSDKSGSQSGQCTSDKHYIVFFDAPSDEICDCCVLPISAPYYNCPECHLILHKSCGDLPSQIHHPLHADHPLTLLNPSLFYCKSCGYGCTGFAFHCAICPNFYLDIQCSSLPTTIKHEAHKHLLSLQKPSTGTNCKACHEYTSDVAYVCTTKYCNFRLDGDCALLPRTLTHKYDNHALTLKYKPVGIISKEYYCEICEKDVNPRTWFYYCSSRDCDYSFHLSCICRDAQIIYQKVKIGAKIISRRHPCPLTTVLKREMKGGEVSSAVFVECKKCKFIGRTYGYFY
ncbi:hypothetical protein Vadar_013603 [Vaccinium darrowii]|uniref:Uncharacterized protein n=1 Tax=Vaccinium darrowii TaxID=229202 RepID=A0ACB7ZDM7_9ERIC|nr:hypothetical protein Vadar_013603 [Vaccinium darrowii]